MITVSDPGKVGMSGPRLARIGPFFRSRYVETGRLPGVMTLVARRGSVVHFDMSGFADVERSVPLAEDTIYRLYSMTKPVTSLALMMLYEEGRFQLDDPLSRFIPGLGSLSVHDSSEPAGPITIQHLLTHTSGFTYGFLFESEVDALYREARVGTFDSPLSLDEMIEALGRLPLLFEPGTRWNYSVSTDVCGRLVEIISGQSLDAYFAARIFEPLGMASTGFSVPPGEGARLAACYAPTAGGGLQLIDDPMKSPYLAPPRMLSGGGGLVGTIGDYLRFCTMLLNGGEGLVGRKTMAYMRSNHLPTGGDLTSMGRPVFSETSYDGIGFGLGFSVMLDPARAHVMGSPGEFAWGGAASTMFWVDPAEELVGMLLTQLVPSSTYPIRREMRVLTYQALA